VKKVFICIIVLVLAVNIEKPLLGQTADSIKINRYEKYYLDVYFGAQVSGIRKEDYIASNFSPYIQLSVGKWLTPYLALDLSYQGTYFNFIGDNFKHKYFYMGGNTNLNINRFFTESSTSLWNINVFAGCGGLYNYFYKKTNFCMNAGLVNEIKIKNGMSLKFKVSAIMGWNIYQEDKDILPNIAVGFSKKI
jgi:hypothetical protein